VTGGAIGSLIGQLLPVTPSERKILLCSGAAAGMAATFGAPLAAVALALELLLFEFSIRSLVPLIVATSVAGGLHAFLFGSGPLFAMPAHEFLGLETMPTFAVLGIVCGLLAVVIAKGLFVIEAGFRRLPVGEFWHPIIGAVGFASVGLIVPGALGVGYDQIGDVLNGRLAVGAVGALLIAKLLAWWVALGSGTSGGTLAPILLIAGCFGSLFGTLAVDILPGAQPSVSAFALVAMAATFGAATRTPFTSIIFLFELTQDYQAVLPLMGATVLAVIVAKLLMRESLMTEKLARRGMSIHNFYELDRARITRVAEVMSAPVASLPHTATVADARRAIVAGPHSAFPLVDDDRRCLGIVTRSDLIDADVADVRPALEVASTDVVTVGPDSSVRDALGVILTEEVEHIPVVDSRHTLIGICTRTDVLRAQAPQFHHEQRDGGWKRRTRKAASRRRSDGANDTVRDA
jgi:chloride channel protein, CIC family